MLADIWPSDQSILEAVSSSIGPEMFRDRYSDILEEPKWDSIPSEPSPLFPWDEDSTYVRLPSFLEGISLNPDPIEPINSARALLKLGDSVTTDHISPAGAFPKMAQLVNISLREESL